MSVNKLYNFYNKLSDDERKELLDVCIDDLGVIDIQTSMQLLSVNRSRIYQIMNDSNTLKIGDHKF